MDREMLDISAKQLIWAVKNKRARWVGNKLVKVWNGHKWAGPDAEFGEVRQRKSDKADVEYFDAEMPDAQVELARSLDAERLRVRLAASTLVSDPRPRFAVHGTGGSFVKYGLDPQDTG